MQCMSGNSEWGRVLLALLVNISRDIGAGGTKQSNFIAITCIYTNLNSRLKSIEQYKSFAVNNTFNMYCYPQILNTSGRLGEVGRLGVIKISIDKIR